MIDLYTLQIKVLHIHTYITHITYIYQLYMYKYLYLCLFITIYAYIMSLNLFFDENWADKGLEQQLFWVIN